jgi:two-component system, sensor histidine kinase and response regulator
MPTFSNIISRVGFFFILIFCFNHHCLKAQSLNEANTQVKDAIRKSEQFQNPSQAIDPLKQVLPISKSSSDSLQALLFLELGINYGKSFVNDTARFYLLKSLTISSKEGWSVLSAKAYNYIGNLYRNKSLNEKALISYDSGLRFLGDLKTRDRYVIESNLLGNIGGIHYDLEEYDKALEFAEKSKSIIVKHNITEWLNYSYLTVAFAARALGQYAKALENNQLALQAMLVEKDSSYLHHTYYNIASLQQLEGDNANALVNFDKALLVAEKFKEEEVAVSCLIAKAQILSKQSRYPLALTTANQALERSQQQGFLPKIIESLNVQYELYKAQNRWREAALTEEQYIVFKDSLFNVQSKAKLATIETQYETEKKEQQIKELQQTNTIKDLEATTARQWQIGLIVFLVLLSMVVGVLYNRYQIKQRTAKMLDGKNTELQKLNGFKDRMFAVISHDLRNPVDAFNTIIESLSQNSQHASKEELKEFLDSTLQSAKDLKGLLNNLLEWSLVQIGKLPFNPTAISLREVTQQSIAHLDTMAAAKRINIQNHIPQESSVMADPSMMIIALRNLISNAIKFSEPGKSIELTTQSENGKIQLKVIDQGAGMSKEDVAKLFKMEQSTQQIGNSVEKGAGIGLLLVKELVERNQGRVSVTSQPGKGSTFVIELPKI